MLTRALRGVWAHGAPLALRPRVARLSTALQSELVQQPLQAGLLRHVEALVAKHDDLNERMVTEGYTTDRAKQLARLAPVANAHAELRETEQEVDELTELLSDASTEKELKEMARDELEEGERLLVERRARLVSLLVPREEQDDRQGAMIEVHAGVGGSEAGLFAQEMLDMYRQHAKRCGWQCEVRNQSLFEGGGVREATLNLRGDGVYAGLRGESGVHRVQRVPDTEKLGRVHTSTAVVMVLPEAEEADEVELADADFTMETFRSGGSGGQSVNTTDSAVRLTHTATGIKVACQDERSQHQNKARALQMLRSKLLAIAEEKRQAEQSAARGEVASTGGRSERIRTYNFADDRVTDHRLGVSKFGMPRMLETAELLQELIDDLRAREASERLEAFLREVGSDTRDR